MTNNRKIYAMKSESLQGLLETTQEIMQAKNGMTAEDMRTAIADIYAAADLYLNPETKEDYENIYKVKNGVAIIPIVGVLTPKANPCAAFFGSAETEYGYISAAIEKAELDPMVTSVDFYFDTPGGYVDGVDEAAAAIATMKKPNRGFAQNMAASAGYWLISQCDEIIATSRTTLVGSIGVAVQAYDYSGADEKQGIKVYQFVNDDSPKKRPDISTEEGQQQIVDRLNDTFEVFVSRVSEGRGVSAETVKSDFGKGDVLIAEKALAAGMIDEIIDYEGKKKNKIEANNNPVLREENITQEGNIVNLTEFLEKNPEARAEVDSSVNARAEEAVKADRDRVSEILALSGVKINENILSAITDGTTAEGYAVKELKAYREANAKVEAQNLGTFKAPEVQPEAPPKASEKPGAFDAAVDSFIAKKKGGK